MMKKRIIDDLWNEIEKIPFRSKKLKEPLGTILFSLPDIPAYVLQNMIKNINYIPKTPPFFYPYRNNIFIKRVIKVKKGLKIKTVVGERKGNKKTIILVHGIFQSKNFRFIRDIAEHLYNYFNFNVIVIDLRDHLETGFLSPCFPASSGFFEGKDILEIASQIKFKNTDLKIFLLGFSYGGGIVLNALNSYKANKIISGVIAVSPSLILEDVVNHIDTNPGFFSSFHPIYNLFKLCLFLRYRFRIKTFDEYLEIAAKKYGFEKYEMMRSSSVTEFIDRIDVPALIILSKDDPVIPRCNMKKVLDESQINKNVKVLVKNEGGHIAFSFIASSWFFKVIDKFAEQF
ncbi:alpha/beta fold hydrolase [candidate division WOR-3 bacterium]|nr:alpha/beta fold hydrolase [candidate division WOR-3 bacterium]